MEARKTIQLFPTDPPPQPCSICQWRVKAAMWLIENLARQEEIPEKREALLYSLGLLSGISDKLHD